MCGTTVGDHRLREGRIVMLVAAVAWSSAGVIQRSLHVDAATQIAGRAVFATIALFLLAVVTERGRLWRSFAGMGRSGLAIAVLTAISSGTFLLALNHASVANVLFMQAIAPFLAALLAWLLLRESVAGRTWAAMAIAGVGVGFMIGGPRSGSAIGHLLTFVMTLAFAAMVVVTRHRRDASMVSAVCLSQLLVVVAVGPFSHPGTLGGRELLFTGAMGGGQIGLGLALLTVGARLLPAAEVAVISLLEVVIGPLWVWLAYAERPATATLIGGGVVVAAVAIQAMGDLRATRGLRVREFG